jgi:hypothetical protein
MRIIKFFILLCMGVHAFGLSANTVFPDRPSEDESFSRFLTRITRGGQFNGLYLTAPAKFEQIFYKSILHATWLGERNEVRKGLINQGVDYWFDWKNKQSPRDLLFPDQGMRQKFMANFENQDFINKDFKDLSVSDLNTYILGLLKSPIFKINILEALADLYGQSAQKVISSVEIKIVDHEEFKLRVKELGYTGQIYFRAISGELISNPGKYLILINQDLMKRQTSYDVPTFQFLEYLAILTHELSHVFQDYRAKELNLVLSLNSFEGLFVLEGMAEYFAEIALVKFAQNYPGLHAFELFVKERGFEVISRPGNRNSGKLFPYTVGTPFVRALVAQKKQPLSVLRDQLLYLIPNGSELQRFLSGQD